MSEKYNFFLLKGYISNINEIKEQKNKIKFRYFSLAQNYDKNENDHQVSFYNIKIYEKDFSKIESLKVGNYILVTGYLKSYLEDGKLREIKIAKEIINLSKNNVLSSDSQEILKELENYKWFEEDSESLE